MRRILTAMAVVAVVLLVAGTVAAGTGSQGEEPHQFTIVERPRTDTVIDIGASGDSTGDLLTFSNKLYDASNTDAVGRDQGSCIRIDPEKGTWQCSFTNFLEGGSITVEGPFFDTRDSAFAVTGGTGVFRNVRGVMRLHTRNDGNLDFVFKLNQP